jgi:preprotein translocase subunit SecG
MMNSRLTTTVMAFFMIVGLVLSVGYSISAKPHKEKVLPDQAQSESTQ